MKPRRPPMTNVNILRSEVSWFDQRCVDLQPHRSMIGFMLSIYMLHAWLHHGHGFWPWGNHFRGQNLRRCNRVEYRVVWCKPARLTTSFARSKNGVVEFPTCYGHQFLWESAETTNLSKYLKLEEKSEFYFMKTRFDWDRLDFAKYRIFSLGDLIFAVFSAKANKSVDDRWLAGLTPKSQNHHWCNGWALLHAGRETNLWGETRKSAGHESAQIWYVVLTGATTKTLIWWGCV